MSRLFFGYVRVSTARQGVEGVSLQAQRDAIQAYAAKSGFIVSQWFEEQQTAAKRGRPVLGRMLKDLRAGKATGVIMHKIDRGARNLRDWADLAELMDTGIVVHFANDGLDLSSRGGRLSADIQAVVAADFIRNLREETKKGLLGRLNQGLYPWGAPLGYINNGSGRPKTICPTIGPIVKQAFELYAEGEYTLASLTAEMQHRGLVARNGRPLSQTGLSTILNNSFYVGTIYKMGGVFEGKHEPLVSQNLFDRVQAKLDDRTNAKTRRHEFTYRRTLDCHRCGKTIIGERHSSSVNIYYRCQTRTCKGTIVRESDIDLAAKRYYSVLAFQPADAAIIAKEISMLRADWNRQRRERREALNGRLAQLDQRLSRLTDALLDGTIERPLYQAKKEELLITQTELRDEMAGLPVGADAIARMASDLMILGTGAYYAVDYATQLEKRKLLKAVFSNRMIDVKNVVLEPRFPFDLVFECAKTGCGSPLNTGNRTLTKVVKAFWNEAVRRIVEGIEVDEAV